MSLVYNESENPYGFSHGGRAYIVPPRQGGTYEQVTESFVDPPLEPGKPGKPGFRSTIVLKSAEPKHGFLTDIPEGAIAFLKSGIQKKQQRLAGVVLKFKDEVENVLDQKFKELAIKEAEINAAELELARKIAAATGEPPKKK